MPKPSTIDKFRKAIFDDSAELVLTESESNQLRRIRAIYTMQLNRPNITNREIVSMLKSEHNITSLSQAYRDIAQTQALLGSVPNASKQWIRYTVVESLKSVIEHADKIIENSMSVESENGVEFYAVLNPEVIVRALEAKTKAVDKLAKYSRLGESDPDPIPYEEIVPLPIEFTMDSEIVTGVKVENPEELVRRVKKKFIEDVDYEEIER